MCEVSTHKIMLRPTHKIQTERRKSVFLEIRQNICILTCKRNERKLFQKFNGTYRMQETKV